MSSLQSYRSILACDPGISFFALALVKRLPIHEELWLGPIDAFAILNLKHETEQCARVQYVYCKDQNRHSKMISDRLYHAIQKYREWYDSCEQLIIEQQPPQGLKDVEQLQVEQFRNKAKLISPRALQKHFKMSGMNREQRKTFVVHQVESFIPLAQKQQWIQLERKHDVADAIMMCRYMHFLLHEKWMGEQRLAQLGKVDFGVSASMFFSMFAFQLKDDVCHFPHSWIFDKD